MTPKLAAAGARVVKLIGDEVMFVAADPSAVCQAGSALVREFANDGDDVLPRGGMAYGNVVLRGIMIRRRRMPVSFSSPSTPRSHPRARRANTGRSAACTDRFCA